MRLAAFLSFALVVAFVYAGCGDIAAPDGSLYNLDPISGTEYEHVDYKDPSFVTKFVICDSLSFKCSDAITCFETNAASVCQSHGETPWATSENQKCYGVFSPKESNIKALNGGMGVVLTYKSSIKSRSTVISVSCNSGTEGVERDGPDFFTDGSYHINIRSKHGCMVGKRASNGTVPSGSRPYSKREILLLTLGVLVIIMLIIVIGVLVWYTHRVEDRAMYGDNGEKREFIKQQRNKKKNKQNEVTEETVLIPDLDPSYQPTAGGTISNRPIEVKKIYKFLKKIEMHEYAPNFIRGGYEQMSIVKMLTDNDLKSIGIVKAGHRKKIIVAIRKRLK